MSKKLKELLVLRYGKRQTAVEDSYGTIPIYGTGGIFGYANRSLYSRPSILIGRKGTIDIPFWVDTPFWCVDTMFYSEIKEDFVIPKYLFYNLLTINFANYNEGTTIPSLRIDTLNDLDISIHNIPDQQHIVDILGSIDDKIENNERMRGNLIEYCTALYTNWSHKINCMVELGTVIDIFDSKRVPLSSRERSHRQGRYPYYGATRVLDYIDDFIFSGEYVLLAEDGTVVDNNGNPIVQLTNGNFWVNNHAHILRGKNGVSNYLLYLMLSNINVTSVITGAVQLKINQANMCKLLVPKPSNLCELNNVISPLFEKILSVEKENQKLNELKQLYLKKFFG